MRNKILVIILIVCSGFFAQNEFPGIESKDLHENSIINERIFDGESLWGYIDGGADLYLEYGFARLLVQELDLEQIHFTVNIYQMNDSASAFGIYSISKYKCSKVDSICLFNCISNFQFQITKGKYYIQIINNKGNNSAQDISKKIAVILLAKTDLQDIRLPQLFQNELLSKGIDQLKYMNGILGIQNGYPDWIDHFTNATNFSLYLLPVEENDNLLIISLIEFSDEGQMKEFFSQSKIDYTPKDKFKKYTIDDKTIAVSNHDGEILYLESDNSFRNLDAYIEMVKSWKY